MDFEHPTYRGKFVLNINAGASPCAIICRPYGTNLLQSFYQTPIYANSSWVEIQVSSNIISGFTDKDIKTTKGVRVIQVN